MSHIAWVEKYRPETVDQLVMSDDKKKFFQDMINKQEPISLLLHGPQGVGKTTTARAIVKSLDADSIFVGSAKDRGIAAINTKVEFFARTKSLEGKRKIVILDEADLLTPDAQLALRPLIEAVSKNCSFIMTANYPNKIIAPLHSRCYPIDLSVEDTKEMRLKSAQFCSKILDNEGVKYDDKKIIGRIVNANFPDIRSIVTSLQIHSMDGEITDKDITKIENSSTSHLIDLIKSKKFTETHKWVMENIVDPSQVVEQLWGRAEDFDNSSLPYLAVHLNDAQNQMTVAPNKHLVLLSCIANIMSSL